MARNSELQRYRDVGSGNLPASITATSTELNVLDGIASTLTYDELNILDGVTATAAEINKLDGLTPIGFLNTTATQSKTDDYTAVLADANTHIDFGAASGKTFTIPANASVAYPVGTMFLITKSGANTLTIAITSDTLISLATPVLAASGGAAMFFKVAATTWVCLSGDIT